MNWRLFLVSAVAAFVVAIVVVKFVGSNSTVASETIVLYAPSERGLQSAPAPDSASERVIDFIVNALGIPLDHIDVKAVGVAAMIGFALGFVGDLVRSLFAGEFSVNLALGTAVGMASSVVFQSTLVG